MLTPAERALLFVACWDHPVVACEGCGASFKMHELATDLFRGLSHLCPYCRVDLTEAAREHLISCGVAARLDAQNVVAEARALQETSAKIRKDVQQQSDRAERLRAEAEAQQRKTKPKS